MNGMRFLAAMCAAVSAVALLAAAQPVGALGVVALVFVLLDGPRAGWGALSGWLRWSAVNSAARVPPPPWRSSSLDLPVYPTSCTCGVPPEPVQVRYPAVAALDERVETIGWVCPVCRADAPSPYRRAETCYRTPLGPTRHAAGQQPGRPTDAWGLLHTVPTAADTTSNASRAMFLDRVRVAVEGRQWEAAMRLTAARLDAFAGALQDEQGHLIVHRAVHEEITFLHQLARLIRQEAEQSETEVVRDATGRAIREIMSGVGVDVSYDDERNTIALRARDDVDISSVPYYGSADRPSVDADVGFTYCLRCTAGRKPDGTWCEAEEVVHLHYRVRGEDVARLAERYGARKGWLCLGQDRATGVAEKMLCPDCAWRGG